MRTCLKSSGCVLICACLFASCTRSIPLVYERQALVRIKVAEGTVVEQIIPGELERTHDLARPLSSVGEIRVEQMSSSPGVALLSIYVTSSDPNNATAACNRIATQYTSIRDDAINRDLIANATADEF